MTTRRTALKTIALASTVLASQTRPVLAQSTRVKIVELAKLDAPGASVAFEFNSAKALLARVAKPEKPNERVLEVDAKTFLTAYTTACTHLGCQLDAPEKDLLGCGCHGSVFNLDGSVNQGPAKRPLQGIRLELDAGVVYAVALIPISSG